MVRDKKTGQVRKFQLNQSTKAAIIEYTGHIKDFSPDHYLFASRKGENRPISRIQAWQVLNEAAQRAGINKAVGTHSLRKTFGYHAYKQGTDISHLQRIFNHLAPSITLRYIGVTEEEIEQVQINVNL